MNKEAEIVKLLRQYLLAFPNATMQDSAWAIYARALSTLSMDEINAAMLKLLTTCKFWPSVAKITINGNTVPAAAEAWGEVMQLARRNGMDRQWDFSCEEVKYTLKMFGGKQMICMMQESDMPTCRAQFMRMYNEICEKWETERQNKEVLARLPKANREALKGKIVQLAEAKKIAEGAA